MAEATRCAAESWWIADSNLSSADNALGCESVRNHDLDLLDNARTGTPLTASQKAHFGLPFANPMAPSDVDAALATLPIGAGASIVDTGCGNGEILARAVRCHGGIRGVGVDLDPVALASAKAHGDRLPLSFELRDAAEVQGTFDAAINVAASHAYGDTSAALAELRRLAPAALFGEGFWMRRPSTGFLEALGGASEDELTDLPGLRDAIRGHGFEILGEWRASTRDWANYEQTLIRNAERDGSPECMAYAGRIRRRRALPDGLHTLGFGLFVLIRR